MVAVIDILEGYTKVENSSQVALVEACKAIELGDCDVALVGGSSVTLHPGVSVAFKRLKMLSPSSACQSFSKHGDGYARAEGAFSF